MMTIYYVLSAGHGDKPRRKDRLIPFVDKVRGKGPGATISRSRAEKFFLDIISKKIDLELPKGIKVFLSRIEGQKFDRIDAEKLEVIQSGVIQ